MLDANKIELAIGDKIIFCPPRPMSETIIFDRGIIENFESWECGENEFVNIIKVLDIDFCLRHWRADYSYKVSEFNGPEETFILLKFMN